MTAATAEARAEFQRGARLKIDGLRAIQEGQDAMERAAWMAVDNGIVDAKTEVHELLVSWLPEDETDAADTLGISVHSVTKWLLPRNRARVSKEGSA